MDVISQQKLPIGKSDFSVVIEDNCYYIDKTMFIKEVTDASPDVLLIPRPRRFGKTLNLSMLRYFYEKSEEDRKKLFMGLAVCNEKIFKLHQGRYPLIWMTFKDVKEDDWKKCLENLK